MLVTDALTDTWNEGDLFFRLQLALLGILAFRSRFGPWVYGIMLEIPSLSCPIDSSGLIIRPGLNLQTSLVFGWEKLIFLPWQLIRGGIKTAPAGS